VLEETDFPIGRAVIEQALPNKILEINRTKIPIFVKVFITTPNSKDEQKLDRKNSIKRMGDVYDCK
jgi:hypothetical protein